MIFRHNMKFSSSFCQSVLTIFCAAAFSSCASQAAVAPSNAATGGDKHAPSAAQSTAQDIGDIAKNASERLCDENDCEQKESEVTELYSDEESNGGILLIPSEAKRTKSGYAYAVIHRGSEEKPSHADAVKLRLRVRNLEGKILDSGERTLSIAHSTPFFEEILPLMHIGETLRVWGDKRDVWEIEMIGADASFRATFGVEAPPPDASALEGYPDVFYKIADPGSGEPIARGDAARIHVSRWDSGGAIAESTRAGRGMVYFLNEKSYQTDPIHAVITENLRAGARVLVWIPAHRAGLSYDIAEEIEIAEALPQLVFPSLLPGDNASAAELGTGTKLVIEENSAQSKLTEGDSVNVDMTCWNGATRDLVDATYLRGKPDIMDIGPKLGIYFGIMTQLGVGDAALVQIPEDDLPPSVGMMLVCRIKVLGKVPEAPAAPESDE